MKRRVKWGPSDVQRPRTNGAISGESIMLSGKGERKRDFMKEVGLLSRRAFGSSSG